MLKLSVIIPTYKDWPRLKACLDSLKNQTLPPEHFEVIVVNNDSDEDFPPEFSTFGDYKFLTETKVGSYAARNAALKIAKGEYTTFTDSDCKVEPHFLERVVSTFDSDSKVFRIGGKVQIVPDEGAKNSFAFQYESIFAFRQEMYCREGGAVTANMSTRRNLFDEVGRFNDELKSGGDVEWGKRALAKGYDIVYRDDIIVYHPSRSLGEILRKQKRVVGGNFQRKTMTRKALLINYLMPPVKTAKQIFAIKEKSNQQKFKILGVVCLMKLTGLTQIIKMILGAKADRV